MSFLVKYGRAEAVEAEAAAALPADAFGDAALFAVNHFVQARDAMGDGVGRPFQCRCSGGPSCGLRRRWCRSRGRSRGRGRRGWWRCGGCVGLGVRVLEFRKTSSLPNSFDVFPFLRPAYGQHLRKFQIRLWNDTPCLTSAQIISWERRYVESTVAYPTIYARIRGPSPKIFLPKFANNEPAGGPFD